jgi:hypothetical protein
MRDFLILFVHMIVTVTGLARRGGLRAHVPGAWSKYPANALETAA